MQLLTILHFKGNSKGPEEPRPIALYALPLQGCLVWTQSFIHHLVPKGIFEGCESASVAPGLLDNLQTSGEDQGFSGASLWLIPEPFFHHSAPQSLLQTCWSHTDQTHSSTVLQLHSFGQILFAFDTLLRELLSPTPVPSS